MDSETSTRHDVDLLERVLRDGKAAPMHLPFSLLENITNSFSEDRQIGSGGFAVVYKGIVGKEKVAVKKLSTSSLPEDKFNGEVECLTKARHKNVVRFVGYCSDTQKRIAYVGEKFVMADIRNWLLCFEYVPNGSLDKYITDASRGLEWRDRYGVIKGICEGLLHLHERHILHLDLKPGNILLDDHMVPKIADFGLSKCLDKEQSQAFITKICGSLGYFAPEYSSGEVAFTSDIYSLGVIILEILTGKKGYPEDKKVIDDWKNRLEGLDHWDVQLEQVRVCMKIGIECMDLDPKKRPVARHIIDTIDGKISSIETSINSLSFEQQVTFLEEQYYQKKTTKLPSEYPGKDKGEQAVTEETVEHVVKPGEDHWHHGQEKALGDQWSSWGVQDTKQNVSPQGASISSSNPGGRYKLKNQWNGGPTLASVQNLKRFQRREHIEFLKSSNIILKDGLEEVCKRLLDNVPVTLRKLGQYSLLQDLDGTHGIGNYITLGLVDKAKKGRKKGKPINLSTQMMESIIDSLLQSQGHLANGVRSLRNHEMLSWACQAGDEMVTHNILVWHVATTICKHNFEARVANNGVEAIEFSYEARNASAVDTAFSLSKYCAYLVAFLPDLLPGQSFETTSKLNKSIEEARCLLKGTKTMDRKCERLLESSYIKMDIDIDIETQLVVLGAQLARQLMDIENMERWKVLSGFWAEMVLYVAPPCDYSPEEGEFITHLWALLMHAGVLERGPVGSPTADTFFQ